MAPPPPTPQPRWSRRHSAHWPPRAPTAPARLWAGDYARDHRCQAAKPPMNRPDQPGTTPRGAGTTAAAAPLGEQIRARRRETREERDRASARSEPPVACSMRSGIFGYSTSPWRRPSRASRTRDRGCIKMSFWRTTTRGATSRPRSARSNGSSATCSAARRKVAMVNEVLCKLLCRNLVVLIHEMYELGRSRRSSRCLTS